MNTATIAREVPTAELSAPFEAPRAIRRKDERLFRLLMCVSLPLCLVGATVTRLLPWLDSREDTGPRGSILAEAVSSARSAIAIALNN